MENVKTKVMQLKIEEEDLGPPPGFAPIRTIYQSPVSASDNETTNRQGDVEDDDGPPPSWEFTSLARALPTPPLSSSENRKNNKNGEFTMAKGQKNAAKSTKKDNASRMASDLVSMVKDLEKLPLSMYREDLERTPFKFIFRAITENKVVLGKTFKYEEDIIKILSTYDSVTKSFNIRDFQMSISREDVKQIFGVVDGSGHIKPQERTFHKTPFYHRCFQDREEKMKEEKNGKTREYKLTRSKILTKLEGIEKIVDLKHRSEDFARLATLFVLSACLAPTSSQGLMWKCTEHVNNPSTICSLDWSGYILETLTTSIGQSSNKAFGGCLILLPYWLCEKFNIIKPMETNAFPRFLKWDLQQLHMAMLENMSVFENSFVLESDKTVAEAQLKLPQGSVTREDIAVENRGEQTSITHDETNADPITQQNIDLTLGLDRSYGESTNLPTNDHSNSQLPTLELDTLSGENPHLPTNDHSNNIQSLTMELDMLSKENANLPTTDRCNIQPPLNSIDTIEYGKTKGELENSEKRRGELESDAIIEDLKEKLRQSEEAKDELKSDVQKSRAKVEELKEKLKISEEVIDELKSDAEKSRAKIEELEEKLKTSEAANDKIKGKLDKSEKSQRELESHVRGIVEELQERLKKGEEDKDQPADQQLAPLPEINRKHVGNSNTRELRANEGAIKRRKECENEQPSNKACH